MVKVNREKFKVLEGVFDEQTLETLNLLKQKKYFDVLLNPIKTGKEADVYLSSKDKEYRAIKLYRVTSSNFKKITSYINRDFRFKNIKGNLRKVIFFWVQKEYRNLMICHKENMNVPFVYKQMGNIIIMEYIDGGMLKDVVLDNPSEFFEMLLEQMFILKKKAKLIHGDLSEFNILVKNQIPYIIDLGQAMTIKNVDDFNNLKDLYLRDVENVVKYFNKRYKLNLILDEILEKLE